MINQRCLAKLWEREGEVTWTGRTKLNHGGILDCGSMKMVVLDGSTAP